MEQNKPRNKTVMHHICNRVADAIAEEFPALTLVFIIHNDDSYKKTLEFKSHEILKHPAGKALLESLEQTAPDNNIFASFGGITKASEKNIIRFFQRKKSLATIIVNADLYKNEKETTASIFAALYPALLSYKKHLNKNTDQPEQLSNATANMLGDAFTAIYYELIERKGSITNLAKKRCENLFTQAPKTWPENNPYPLIYDIANTVYKERKAYIKNKNTPLQNALILTEELSQTCDDNIERQWQSFAKPALEMLWSGTTEKCILGAAAHASESVFNRSTAYLIADILNIDPSPAFNMIEYNPFREDETLERLHLKVCDEKFQKIISGNHEKLPQRLRQAANKQTHELLNGKPIGWSAPALIEACVASKDKENPLERTDAAKQAFTQNIALLSWPDIHTLYRNIIQQKRDGIMPDFNTIMDLLRHNDKTHNAAISFKVLIERNEKGA